MLRCMERAYATTTADRRSLFLFRPLFLLIVRHSLFLAFAAFGSGGVPRRAGGTIFRGEVCKDRLQGRRQLAAI